MAPTPTPIATLSPHISDPVEAVRIARLLGMFVVNMDRLHGNPEAQAAYARRMMMWLIELEAGAKAHQIISAIEMFSPLSPPENRIKMAFPPEVI